MKIIDSNIIIYSNNAQHAYLRPLVSNPNYFVSAITKVEVLGYHKLSPNDKAYFESVFQVLTVLDVDSTVVDKAVELRQRQKISLGDSLIAASALLRNFEVNTNNMADFQGIPNLKVFNPL